MSRPGILLPVIQNWSCHNCGGCCREHMIAITAAEKARIEKQKWNPNDGTPSDRPLIVPFGSAWRLNHQADGACVFLDSKGLCRIHARFGEDAKPLACRVYPYAIHPAGTSVTTSLRFSCPSVVQNAGTSVAQQRKAVEEIAREVVPSDYRAPEGPELFRGHRLSWQDMTLLLAWFERSLGDTSVRLVTRMTRVLSWLDLLEQSSAETLTSDQFGALLPLLHEASVRAQLTDATTRTAPKGIARLMFRQLLAVLLRHDTVMKTGIGDRLGYLAHGLRFTLGRGRVPWLGDPNSVRTAFMERANAPAASRQPVFAELETVFRGPATEIDELLTRYVRVKLQGMHFFGAAFYEYSVIDGFRSLALMLPATIWVARLRAAREGRTELLLRDVQASLATVDHNFGYSPALGLSGARRRVQQLAQLQQMAVLCQWYADC